MVVGKMRRTLKRSLSMAMAAALMVTSVPQLSVTSMAQEETNTVQENGTDEKTSEVAQQGETEEGKSQNGDSTESVSTDESTTEDDKQNSDETQKTGTEQSDEDDDSEKSEINTDAEEEDGKELEQDNEEDESETEEEEKKVSDSDKERAQEDEIEGKLIYENDFNSETVGTELAGGTVAKLADKNMAIEYNAELKGEWEDIFQAGFDLSPAHTEAITKKMTMSFDVYFPKEGNDNADGSGTGEDGSNSQSNDDGTVKIGKMAAKAALKVGDESQWTEGSNGLLDLTDADLVDAEIDGYSKFHIELDMSSNTGWEVKDITSIRTVVPCLAGNGSTYQGKVYLDNVVLKDTSTTSGEVNPGEGEDPEKPTGEEVFYENDFDDETELEDVVNIGGSELPKDVDEKVLVSIAELKEGTGNKAIKVTTDLSATDGWKDIFKIEIDLPDEYAKTISDKVVMSYDLYFPEESVGNDFGTMTAMPGLKNGTWTWVTEKQGSDYTTMQWAENSDVEGYKVFHVEIDMNDFQTWDGNGNVDYPFADITPIKAVIPCLAGNTSKYKGDIYLDNLKVKAVGVAVDDNPDKPGEGEKPFERDLIYKNDFNELTGLEKVLSENVTGANPTLADLATGNKAVKYSVKLKGDSWEDIFKAQFNLTEPYGKTITDKVVMSYDVYFPADKVGEGFDSMKAQAALSCGSWTWASAKLISEFKSTDLADDADVPNYKKVHIEIDMTDFETWDNAAGANKPYPFENITPIQAVIPCFAGAGSTYEGDLYLDNLEVWAVNESGGELPPVEGDLALDLDASSWSVGAGYQYTGTSTIRNTSISDNDFLVFNVDYSKDYKMSWSEAKFEYTHPESVANLQGYNAFKADIYYKPTAGSFGIKLFSSSPKIEKDIAVPVGEPADIPGLEGYYKAEYVLSLRIPAGAFQNLTFGLVGKNTDYQGDIYLSNMRFTQVFEEDIYVDSTISPKKGLGVKVVDDGRNIQTASEKKFPIAEEVALVDANANEATKNLYAYLKAVGESDSVIFGHQNDTHHKAGSAGDDFSNSDTEDVTGSIAGVVGIDALSLTGNEALTWDATEADRIAHVAEITREAAEKGALITLSAHMPNFDVIDKRVKAYEASGMTGTDSDSFGYWEVDGEKQYNFSGYTPGTFTGNVVARIMPGQDLNYLYTDYLDLIADYAKAVEDDGITILFRPLHENTGSWFWWGAAFCDEQAYIALYRYTVDYLKETRGVHNMIYVYGPGSEAANVAEYSARYPGDAYVDMIGYDLYHSGPSQENEEIYLQSISKQNAILKEFAEAHNKLYAITETGVADKDASGEDIALRRRDNKVMNWYMKLLDEISDDGVCYFLVWANFSENGSFYLPYVVEKKENGVLHGHEMMDEFIRFYNDGRSVFATDMNSEFKKINGVTNTTEAGAATGYIIAPQSGDRLLTGEGNTRIAAMIAGEVGTAKVQFTAAAGDNKVVLEAAFNEQQKVWEAFLTDEQLLSLGEIPGTIALNVGEKELAVINARFNLKEPEQDDMVPEDFESYAGSNRELNSAWPVNKASGSEITLVLTGEEGKVFGGKYGMQMNITLASSDAWVGATKSFEADWSQGNALELYTIPEAKGQKVVVQVKSNGEEFEVWLNEYEEYAKYAADGTPVKVTIPFSAFAGKKNGTFDPEKIEVIGLWCNALPNENVTYPLSTTICYDELRVVTTDQTTLQITSVSDIPGMDEVSGNIISPQTGDRILPDAQNPNTRLVAKVSGVKPNEADVRFVVKTVFSQVVLPGTYNVETDVWEAILEDSVLQNLGRTHGTITLIVNEKEIAAVTVKFNMEEQAADNMVPEDFEGYAGNSQELGLSWISSQASGSEIVCSLTDDKAKVTGGNYALQMEVVLADKDAWAGAVKSLDADWSAGNALEFDTIPVANGQRIAVQVISGGIVFEAFLQDVEGYAGSAVYEMSVKVTIPFSAFVGKDDNNAVFDPSTIEGIGLWCGASEKDDIEFPLSSTLCYDEFKVVTTDKTVVNIESMVKKGIWIKAIPDQTYTGKAIKPEVQVYDDAKLLTLKKDYTVSYKNNTKVGAADVIIKGKGNYSGTGKFSFEIVPKQVEELIITAPDYLIENGREQNITVTVKDGKKKLSAKNDYTQVITYNGATVSKAKETGTYAVTITMKGNYKGEAVLNCEMADSSKLLLSKASVTLPAKSLNYNDGNPVVFEDESRIIVKLGGKQIPQKGENNVDNYTISYENNSQVGTASVVITAGAGSNYVGSCRKTFAVNGTALSKGNIEVTDFQAKLPYTGKTIYQNPVLTDKTSSATLEKNVDYRIAYQNNLNAGKATMIITGLGKYSGTIKNTFTIEKVGLTKEMVASSAISVLQNRAGATPDVTITYMGNTLVKDRDYKLTYTNNKNITTASKKAYISIAGKGNYSGSLKNAVEFEIAPKSWDSGEITVEIPDIKYGNKAQYTPNPVVYDNGKKLTKNKDYVVRYESNTKEDIGTITEQGHTAGVIITLTGDDYVVEGKNPEKSFAFRIIAKLISEAKISIKSTQYFSQYGIEPGKDDLEVTYKNTPVTADEYDIISYEKNDRKGKATLVIQGKGQYGGTKKVTFAIKARELDKNLAEAIEKIMSVMMEQL